MAVIVSNGAGGGNYSAGGSWVGGVAPGLGDNAQIAAGDIITIDATFTVGDDTATPALDILAGGELDWDNLGVDVCTFRGDFYVRNGGLLTLDGTAVRTNILTIELNDSAALANGKYGLLTEDGAIIDVDGFDYTRAWDTLSADAAAAQPNVVSTNDNSAIWFVGDAFVVGSMSEDAKTGAEEDTIGAFAGATITKAGANYGFAHEQNVAICHLTRNIVFTDSNVAFPGYIFIRNTTPGNIAFGWCRFDTLGVNANPKFGLTFSSDLEYGSFDGCVIYQAYNAFSNGQLTLADTITVYTKNRDITSAVVQTVTDSVFIGSDRACFTGQTTVDTVSGTHFANYDENHVTIGGDFTDCRFYGGGGGGTGSVQVVTSPATYDGCSFDGEDGIRITAGITRFTDCTFGAQVANDVDFIDVLAVVIGTGINTIVLDVTVSGSADNKVSIEDTTNNHKTWKAAGDYEKQNVVVRSGTFAMLMSPTSATEELIAPSTVPAENGTQIVVSAYLRKNAAYGAANLPFIRLSGKGMTTVTDTMPNVNDSWQLVTVAGTPTSDGFATVEIVAQSAGVGAAAYADDIKMVYTLIDTGTMDFWYQGDMPTVLMATGLGAVDVWDVLLTQISTPLSIGALLETNVDEQLTVLESNIRGADSDDLKTLSDQIDGLPAGVWAFIPRTLTAGGGASAAEVWSYVVRTLTQPAAQLVNIVEGSVISVYQFNTWTFSLTGLGDLTGRAALYFTAKENVERPDGSQQTILQVEETIGLIWIGGEAAANPLLGTLVVDNVLLGNITITVDETVTGMPSIDGRYDVKMITVAGAAQILTISVFEVYEAVTRAVT